MACGGAFRARPDSPPINIDADGNLAASVSGIVDIGAIASTVDVAVPGGVDVSGSTVDVGSIADPIQTKPAAWSPVTGQRGNTVTDSPTQIIGATTSPDRVYVRFTNQGPNNAFIYPDSGVTVNDTLLAVGQSMEFHGGYTGVWYGITAAIGQTANISAIVMTT
jgi:hypothetical protein